MFCLMAWIFEAAEPFNGVCTYVGASLPDGFSIWELVQELLGSYSLSLFLPTFSRMNTSTEAVYIVANVLTELRFRKSRLHPVVLRELRFLTRTQIFIILWDFVFRIG